MKNKFFWAIVISLFTVSCSSNDVFFQYKAIAPQGWNKDSVCTFNIPITDTTAVYNVYLNVRNRGEYPYQNLWIFLRKVQPDSTLVRDSVECYLADQRGKWLGSGVGSVYEMPILYQQNIRYKTKGTYRYQIAHGMRDSILVGINDIGVRVEKVKKP